MIKLYSKPNCVFCNRAKAHLNSKGIKFAAVDISKDPTEREFLLSEGHKMVPQLYFNGKLLVEGGWEGLSKLSDEELTSKIGSS